MELKFPSPSEIYVQHMTFYIYTKYLVQSMSQICYISYLRVQICPKHATQSLEKAHIYFRKTQK